MAEERFEVRTIGIRYICDCGKEMTATGDYRWSDGDVMNGEAEFPHVCENGHTVYLPEKYPTVRWEKTEERENK